VLGRPERSSSSADTLSTLKRECHSKTAVRLKNVLQEPHDAFQGFTVLHRKLDADTLLYFAIHRSQREKNEVEKALV
jgi:hypothetical protein